MLRTSMWIAVGLAALIGCGEKGEPMPEAEVPEVGAAPAETAPVESAEVTLSPDEMEQIKTLPEAEQPAALAQKVCPVSDEPLGSMGTPIKVTAEGKTAYLCCNGCKKEFEADPAAALAKLKP